MQFKNEKTMLSHPKLYRIQPNPYLIKNDGKTAIFCPPLWQTLMMLSLAVLFGTAGLAIVIGAITQFGFCFEGVMMFIFGLPVLLCGIYLSLTSGTNKIVIDLQRRAYHRTLLAPLFASHYLDSRGRGNPFLRQTIAGPMSDLKGVQVVERENSTSRMYSVYIVSNDQSIFPCAIYICHSLMDAQAQAEAASSLLGLPVLETLLINNLRPLAAPYRRRVPRNSYLARCDQRTVIFRTPRWRTILGLGLAGFLCGLPVFSVVLSMERWGEPNIFLSIEGLPLIVFGIFIVLSSGANEIEFDLTDRSYRRFLLPLPAISGKQSRNLVGSGNPLGGKNICGRMSDIEGLQLVEGRGRNGRLYAVKLIWAQGAYPPSVVYFSDGGIEDARVQQAEVSLLLNLPILEPSLLDDPTRLRSRWS